MNKSKVRGAVVARDGDWCLLCGKPPKGLHLHRVRYGSQGGAYELENCVQLCGTHHALVHTSKRAWQPLLLAFLAGDATALAEMRSLSVDPDYCRECGAVAGSAHWSGCGGTAA